MNIVTAPIQTNLAVNVATDIRSPVDDAELIPRNNPIPPLDEAQNNARLANRNRRAPTEDDASGNNQSRNNDAENNANAILEPLTDAEQREVAELAARDREVRAHEQAHANVGGRYAGAPSYQFERGPDGRSYAVAGQVSIDTSPVPNDPEATIAKAQIVRSAALAPAQPSAQDRAVAAQATALEIQARQELASQRAETITGAATSATEAFAEVAALFDPLSTDTSAAGEDARTGPASLVDVIV